LVGAVALAIRLTALNRFSYWLDEIQEVFTIRASWGKMLHALRAQLFNPPLDYLFQKAFDALNPSDAARRVLPALWGAGSVVVLGRLVARRANPRVGLVTALCLAFVPFHVHYSQEVRPYSLGMFLSALTLLLVDRYLDKPGVLRLTWALLSAVAVAYTMLLAALVLALAGGVLVIDDALAGSSARRPPARRLLSWSPALIVLIALAYLPWLPAVWALLKAPPFTTPPTFAFRRVARLFSYFGFGFHDWYPLGWPGTLFIALVVGGAILAVAKYRLRFLLVWAVIGSAAIEALEERHGAWDSIFHFLPAGVALAALATLPIGWLTERKSRIWLAPVALAVVLFLDARALQFYFQRGRPDWRPEGDFLRAQPHDEAILVAGQATQLCVGYYVNGPDWLCCSPPTARLILDVGSDASGLATAITNRSRAWLVAPVSAMPPLSTDTAGVLFPTADVGVTVRAVGSAPHAAKLD
jgi:hypothetical protein